MFTNCKFLVLSTGFLAALATGIAAQQELDPSTARPPVRLPQTGDATAETTPSQAIGAPSSIQRRAFGVGLVDGRILGGGADYAVVFDAGGVTYEPALGTGVPRTLPLRIATDAVSRGGVELAKGIGAAELRLDGTTVVRRLADGLVERWHVRPDGLELTYELARRPAGTGDLVARARIDTELRFAGAEASGGVRFDYPTAAGEDAPGGVTIGAVTGVDATGKRVNGALRVERGRLEMSLPGWFVDSAVYPLVLDPLIGTSFIVGSVGNNDSDPDAAYDATNDEYCVTWERAFSAGDVRVRAQRVDGNGSLAGSLLGVTGGGVVSRNPTIANVNTNARFLLVWQEAPSLFGPWNLNARAIDAGSGAQSTTVTIAGTSANEVEPDAGSEPTTADNEALLVWNEVDGGIRAAQVTVGASPAVPAVLGAALSVTTSAFDSHPAISKSQINGRYLVAWQRQQSTSLGVFAIAMSRNTTLLGSEVTIANFANIDEDHPDVDGDGWNWIVVWERSESTATTVSDIFCRRVAWDNAGSTAMTSGSEVMVEGDASDDEREPAIAFVGPKYVIAWMDKSTTLDYDVGVRAIDPFDCSSCGHEMFSPGTRTYETGIEITSKRSGSTSANDHALIVFGSHDGAPPFTGDVLGQLYQGIGTSGSTTNLGGGCGNGGSLTIGAPIAIGSRITFQLSGATGGSIAVVNLNVSGGTTIPCGPCRVLVPDLSSGSLGVSGGVVNESLVVPCNPSLVSGIVHAQFLTVTLGVAPCIPGAPVSASNIRRFTIGL